MLNVIVEFSKYFLLFLMALFTLESFLVLNKKNEEARRSLMLKQIIVMIIFTFAAYFIMFLQSQDNQMIKMYLCNMGYILIVQVLYRLIYRKASLVLLNNMCMLLSIGFIMLSRLNFVKAYKQFLIVAASTIVSFLVPVIIRKVKLVRDLTWTYAVLGIILLLVVFVMAQLSGGAKLSISIGGVTFQFSEFVKITLVFYMAGMLQEDTSFRRVAITSVVAAVHVGILVLSTDLGTALVYFVAYVVVIYVATHKLRYPLAGLTAMSGASVAAYYLFHHVKQRVDIWKDPFSDYEYSGYQIVQALFGICAGGWFGTGLYKGSPNTIPLADKDFTFAAICEEFGGVFSICLILLCMSTFLLIVNIAMKLGKPFYRLIAMGLGAEYAFQVFLTIGGTTKFIPMTGITLPLVSYGGSSVMCTILMLSIIQGLYVLREDEDEELEAERRKKAKQKAKRAKQAKQPMRTDVRKPVSGQTGQQDTDELTRKIEEQTKKSLHW
ncbi:MAG: FtsW/RodA/SpoVE family cell cycle protein [Lachnospiraceae bacterium]|nr:FtsW/RodA/SpoVE family cell cycle protein [Lachnospiraceae bacterium]